MNAIGIKETKEAMVLGFALAALLKGQLADGFQPADVLKIIEGGMNAEMMMKIKEGMAGITMVPSEIGDIDLMEGMELVKFAIDEIKKIVG